MKTDKNDMKVEKNVSMHSHAFERPYKRQIVTDPKSCNASHISNTLNKCKSSFNSRLNNHRKDFDNLKAVSACNHFQILDQNFIKHFKFTPQPWNLTLAFGSILVNANSWFVVLFVDTWFDMLCLFLLVCQSRESVISNQMFCNNCCSLFTSFWLLFIHIAQKFSSFL